MDKRLSTGRLHGHTSTLSTDYAPTDPPRSPYSCTVGLERAQVLRALPLAELYSRALLHFQHNHFNLLLLVAIQANAIDVVLGECGGRGAQRLVAFSQA